LQTYPELAQKAFSAREAEKETDQLKLEEAIFPALAGGGSVRVRSDAMKPDMIADGGCGGAGSSANKVPRVSPNTPIASTTGATGSDWEAFDMKEQKWMAEPEVRVTQLDEKDVADALARCGPTAASGKTVQSTDDASAAIHLSKVSLTIGVLPRSTRRFIEIEGLSPSHPEFAKMGVYERLDEHVNERYLWHNITYNMTIVRNNSSVARMFLFYVSYTANWKGWYIGRRENIYIDVGVQIAAAQVLQVVLSSVSGESKQERPQCTAQHFSNFAGSADALVSALRDSICSKQLTKSRMAQKVASPMLGEVEKAEEAAEAGIQEKEEQKQVVLLNVINLMWRKEAHVNFQVDRIDKICKAGVLDLAALLANSKNEEVQNGAVDVLSSAIWRVGGSANIPYWGFKELTSALERLNLPGIAHNVLSQPSASAGTICTLMKWPYFFAVALKQPQTSVFATSLLNALLKDAAIGFLPQKQIRRSIHDGLASPPPASSGSGAASSPVNPLQPNAFSTLLSDFANVLDPESPKHMLRNERGYVACNRAADALLGLVKKAKENDQRLLSKDKTERLRRSSAISSSSVRSNDEKETSEGALHAPRLVEMLDQLGATRHLLHTLRQEDSRQRQAGKGNIATGTVGNGQGTTKGSLAPTAVAAGQWVPRQVTVTIAHQGEHGIHLSSPCIDAEELRITGIVSHVLCHFLCAPSHPLTPQVCIKGAPLTHSKSCEWICVLRVGRVGSPEDGQRPRKKMISCKCFDR
jgi:hypothetical protein